MASTSCWRCVARPKTIPTTRVNATKTIAASFSISSNAAYPGKATQGGPGIKKAGPPARGQKTSLNRKKKSVVKSSGKPPGPGERKAMRKRIVLSNTNAFEVPGMRDLDKTLIAGWTSRTTSAGGKEGNALDVAGTTHGEVLGKVVGLQGPTVDSLRAVEAFKASQAWGNFRRPGMLVREESVALSRKMVQAEKDKRALRLVIDGEKVTGKSMMLIHAMTTAFLQNWVVINIPEAQEVTNAVTAYSPLPNTSPILYSQNTYIANLLGQIAKANAGVLQSLEITLKHDNLPIPVQSNISLARLCDLGARDPDIAWPIFQAFWSEITTAGRPPVLFSLDGLSNIMLNSLYHSAEFEPIHAHDLAIIRQFTDILSGASPLPNGGAVIAATSHSHAPISKTLNLCIKQNEDQQAGREITKKDPFEKKYDARVEKIMKGVEFLKLKGLSKVEARGLMEYWAQSGLLRSRVDEKKVTESWALAGNGVVGEIERGTLLMRI